MAVDIRGGSPGTVNTDALRLGYGRAFTDAIVFSGGSSYGEEAIAAVATGLKNDGAVRISQQHRLVDDGRFRRHGVSVRPRPDRGSRSFSRCRVS
jgi:hypothetical protein